MAVLAPVLPALVGSGSCRLCYLPVSAGKEVSSDDDDSSDYLHFYVVSLCCFPLTSSRTAEMFISSRKGEGVMIPAFCHSLSLQGAQSLQAESSGSDLRVVTQCFFHRRAHLSCKCEEGERRSHRWFCFLLRRTTGRENLDAVLMLWQNTQTSAPGLCRLPQCFCLPGEDVLPVPTTVFKEDFFFFFLSIQLYP